LDCGYWILDCGYWKIVNCNHKSPFFNLHSLIFNR
jgi:hypothetical protein